MAELKAMYPGISFSPMTVLTASINAADTVIPVESTAHLPDGPNIATIGADENAEVIIYAAKTANSLSGCTRGVEGTAKAWQVGEVIARNWTRTDYQTLIDNIKELNEHKQEAGDPLATFYPTVTEAGDLSWRNDQGLENPKTVNIKGPAGTPGTRGVSILHTKDMVEYQYTEDSHGNSSYYFQMLIQTIKTQAGVNEVLVGDTILSDLSVGQLYVVTEINGEYAILREGSSVKGDPGEDGVSPTVAVSKSGKVTTISITDKNGTKTATIKDGTSVTVKSVSESTADGGINVVTFSDGKTINIKNGSKGSDGKDGQNGKTPVKGTDYFTEADKQEIAGQAAGMVEIPDSAGYVVQDTAPDDTSVMWVDTSDNTNDGFQEAVNMALAQAKASGEFDGKDGVNGKDGKDGKTPAKGTDYFTTADKTEMVNAVIAALPVYAGEVV